MKKRVTKHGRKRIRGRVGVRNANYMYRLARQKGRKGKSFKDDFGKLLAYLEIKSKGQTIVYNNFIYIIKGGKLITVLNVPYKYQNYKEEEKNEE
jgi:hypothetical protein